MKKNDDGDLGRRLAEESGTAPVFTKSENPSFESKYYELDTLENCRLLMSECLKAVTDGDMAVEMGKFAADVAKKAADTLIKSGNTDAEIVGVLRAMAAKQPALTGRGLEVGVAKDRIEISEG